MTQGMVTEAVLMHRVIEVEHPLEDLKLAPAQRLQLQEGERELQPQ